MPKRSNEFQHLVKVIHDAISKIEGASVTESAMIPEPNGTLREVDILLERSVAGVPIRLAVECRDRSRKSDVDWIDGLIGKFRDLNIDKIVAVSRKGFSATAKAKASANGIELKVLAEALADEWAGEFINLGFGLFQLKSEISSVTVTFDPPVAVGVKPTTVVDCAQSEGSKPTLKQFIHACFVNCVVPLVKRHVEREFLDKFPPLAELTRLWEFNVPVDIRDAWVVGNDGTRHRVSHILFGVSARSEVAESDVRHYRYGVTALASEGQLKIGGEVHKMQVVQVARSKTLGVSITKVKPK